MPLGAREVLVAIRARDVTSRVLREIGTNFGTLGDKANKSGRELFNTGAALTAVGVGMAGVGAAGLAFFNSSIDSFIEYSRQAAYTKTQVDELGVSVGDIADIGVRVANKIPVPFNEMQDALYDIFSSLDVGVKDAEMLLNVFAQGAVAGQTDVRTAARSTISVMNAYKLPFTDANRVMDIMFEMVRKGVGTYEDFNSSIGRAIPAAVSASQEFETLAGIMAFLTRQGLSTQMAATSAARAMELFTKPKVTKALHDIGVETVDAAGNFRQLNDIVMELATSEGWAQMGAADRKQMFKDIFGEGTIQARRFFDTAIPNFKDLNTLTDITTSSAGALSGAYDTMFAEPAMQAQLLANKYAILSVEIGEKLLPAKIRLMEAATKLIDWWNGLSDSTKNLTVKIAAGASAFLAIGGIVLTLVGGFMMLAGVVGGVGAAFGLLLGVPAIIAGIIAITVILIKNWDTITETANNVVDWFNNLSMAGKVLVGVIAAIAAAAVAMISPLLFVVAAGVLIAANWRTLVDWAGKVVDSYDDVVERIRDVWKWFTELSLAGKILIGVVAALVSPWILVAAAVVAAVRNFSTLVDAAKGVWEWFNNLHMVGKILIGVIAALVAPLTLIVAAGVAIAKNWSIVVEWANKVINAAKGVWEWFNNLNTIFRVIGVVIAGVILGLLAPVLALAASIAGLAFTIYKHWSTIKEVTISVWGAIVGAVDVAWQKFKAFWNWLTNIDLDVWGTIKDIAISTWNAVKDATASAAEAIMSVLTPVWSALQTGFDWFMEHFGHQFVEIWGTIVEEVSNVVGEFGETTGALWKYVQFAWDRIKPILLFLVSGWIIAIGLIVGFVKAVLIPVFDVIVSSASGAFKMLQDVLSMLWTGFKFYWDLIFGIVKTVMGVIKEVILTGVKIILSAWDRFGEFLWRPIKVVWDLISGIIKTNIKIISNFIQFFLNIFQGDWGEAWDNIKNMLGAAWDGIVTTVKASLRMFLLLFKDLPGAIIGFFGDAVKILGDAGSKIIMGLIHGASTASKMVMEFFINLGPKIVDLLIDAEQWLFDVGRAALEGLIEGAKSLWGTIKTLASDVFHAIVDGFKSLFGIGSSNSVLLEVGKSTIQGLWHGFQAAWDQAYDWLISLGEIVIDVFTGAPGWLLASGKSIIQGLWDGAQAIWDQLLEWHEGLGQLIIDVFTDAPGWLLDAGKDILQGLWDGIKLVAGYIVDYFQGETGMNKTIKRLFNNAIDWLLQAGKNVLQGLWNGIKIVAGYIVDYFQGETGMNKTIKRLFNTAIDWLLQAGKNILQGLWNGIKNVWNFLVEWFRGDTGIQKTIRSYFNGAIDWLWGAGRNIIIGLKNGILNIVNGIKEWIGKRVDTIINAFKSFFGIHSPSTVMTDVGKNFMRGFMDGVVIAAKNIPKLISKIGMSTMDLLKYLGIDAFDFVGGLFGDLFGGGGKVVGSFQELGKQMAAAVGWTGTQWTALQKLWQAESGWNPSAYNKSSGASGIPQALPASKMGRSAQLSNTDVMSRAQAQISWGLNYIRDRYGTPSRAWQFWQSKSPHWYEKGAWKIAQNELAMLHKGEMVVPKKFADAIRTPDGSPAGRGANFNFYGDVSFGGDMHSATQDLDFWARTFLSGV
jgi:TP901 family phage tail tape measure protein